MDDLYELYETISLDEYLKDKSVEDIVSTCRWLENINEPVFMEMIDYFNTEPEEDLEYTEQHNDDGNCVKCLFPHDNTHKCYAYDRIFRKIVFIGSHGYLNKKLLQENMSIDQHVSKVAITLNITTMDVVVVILWC